MKPILSRPDRWLMWLIVASLTLPPAFFGLVAYQSRRAIFAAADQQLIGTVRLLRGNAQKVLDTDELVVQQVDRLTVGMTWDEIAHSEALHKQLKQLDDQQSEVRGILLVAPDGSIASGSLLFPLPAGNVSDRPYFSVLQDGYPGAFISKVYRGRITGVEQFSFARRRSSPDGSFNGVIVISDSPAYFADAYHDLGNKAASVVLASDDGEELTVYPTPMFAGSHAPADLIASLPQSEPVFVSSIPLPYDGSDRRGAYQRISGYPLFVGYSVPTSSIAASWRRTVVLNGLLVAIGSLTVAFMGWLVLRGVRSERAAHTAFLAEVERREQSEVKMEQAKRMEVIGQLTAGVAHDFNNLLTVISGNVERLRDCPVDAVDARIETALSATARGDNLIRQMLTLAHRQVLNPEVLDVNAELRAFAPLLASALRNNIAVDYRLMATSMVCRIDRTEFEFAILNIATNAGHAMPHGGRLEIDVRPVQVIDGGDDGLDLDTGTYLGITFIDNGEGMPPEVLARAFERFFSTREAGAGTGLGLSQVYEFAKQSGGLATVETAVGRGTTVAMYLPLLDAVAPANASRAPAAC